MWLVLAMVAVLWRGTQLRRRNAAVSFLWLIAVLLPGDIVAVRAFGRPHEVVSISLLALGLRVAWIVLLPNWNTLGVAAWNTGVMATAAFLAHAFTVATFTPQNAFGFLLSFALFLVQTFSLLLSLTFLYETLDVSTHVRWNHVVKPASPIRGYTPKVSLQVPSYNEPPLMVEQTLRSFAR